MTLELPQFGKLAYDLHVPQDGKSLSAVEDVFYMLSDRKPCQMLLAAAGGSSSSSRGRADSGSSSSTRVAACVLPTRGGSRMAGGGGSSSREVGGSGAAERGLDGAGGAAMCSSDLLIPEQFPEALVRLACVRYRCVRVCVLVEGQGRVPLRGSAEETPNPAWYTVARKS